MGILEGIESFNNTGILVFWFAEADGGFEFYSNFFDSAPPSSCILFGSLISLRSDYKLVRMYLSHFMIDLIFRLRKLLRNVRVLINFLMKWGSMPVNFFIFLGGYFLGDRCW